MIPIAIHVKNIDEPPLLISGSGWPVTGNMPVTTPMFAKA